MSRATEINVWCPKHYWIYFSDLLWTAYASKMSSHGRGKIWDRKVVHFTSRWNSTRISKSKLMSNSRLTNKLCSTLRWKWSGFRHIHAIRECNSIQPPRDHKKCAKISMLVTTMDNPFAENTFWTDKLPKRVDEWCKPVVFNLFCSIAPYSNFA